MREVYVSHIVPQMILAEKIVSPKGNLVLGQGTILNDTWINQIMSWGIKKVKIEEMQHNDINDAELSAILNEALQLDNKVSQRRSTHKVFLDLYNELEAKVCNIFLRTRCTGVILVNELKAMAEQIIVDILPRTNVFLFIHTTAREEIYLYRHTLDVAVLAGLLGRWHKFSDKDIKDLVFAGLLHDIGKARVYYEMISKPGPLSEREKDIVQLGHVTTGVKMLYNNNNIPSYIIDSIAQHHEKLDGCGYPEGLKEDEINYFAKVLAIADVYDALTSNRYYKKAVSPFKAAQIMMCEMAGAFDLVYLGTLFNHICKEFLQSDVMLSNGEVGKIVNFDSYPNIMPKIEMSDGSIMDLSLQTDIEIESFNFR